MTGLPVARTIKVFVRVRTGLVGRLNFVIEPVAQGYRAVNCMGLVVRRPWNVDQFQRVHL